MAALPQPLPLPRKPPGSAQYNWLTGGYESVPEQMELPLEWSAEETLGPDESIQLLATESGAQLLVSGFGISLGRKSERVTLRLKHKTCGELPLYRLQEIVLLGHGISISTDLIADACERGIRIAVLNPNGRPVALLTSPFLSATVETRRRQLAALGQPVGADFIRWVAAGKLHNQEKLLRYFAKSRDGDSRRWIEDAAGSLLKLRRQVLAVEGDCVESVRPSVLGCEGAGGRIYWSAIATILPGALGFRGRAHDGYGDPVNAALNYGYGILYCHVWGAVLNAGLEPFAGFLHGDRPGKPSLVLDLVEEFRQPAVDRPLFARLTKGGDIRVQGGLLDGPSREAVASRVVLRLNAVEPHRGKQHQVRSIIQMQARLAASAFRGERGYRPFAFKW